MKWLVDSPKVHACSAKLHAFDRYCMLGAPFKIPLQDIPEGSLLDAEPMELEEEENINSDLDDLIQEYLSENEEFEEEFTLGNSEDEEVDFAKQFLNPIYEGHCANHLTLLLAFFSFLHNFGKNSPNFMNNLLSLVLLCLPEKHSFPDTVGALKKVNNYPIVFIFLPLHM